MCQYSAVDGVPQQWHLVHLGSRAVGGAGLVMAEATGVSAIGRISPLDTGIWNASQAEAFKPIAAFIKEQGAVAGIQLAHAGRKASTQAPWKHGADGTGGGPLLPTDGAWQTIAPSALSFASGYPTPKAMTTDECQIVVYEFENAARNALLAGFEVVEIHMAHGYLLHQFLSPISNHRTDQFGGNLDGRMQLPLQIARAVRGIWPTTAPVFVRVSATDWVEGGWDLPQTVALAKELKTIGVDLIDTSSGGLVSDAKVPVGPGFQIPFARTIRTEADILTGSVGFISDSQQAEKIIAEGHSDVVFIARQFLKDPYFPLRAAKELGFEIPWPKQYERGK